MANLRFQSKVAIITGAGSGIGLATAKRFAREGAQVVLADVSAEHLRTAEAEVRTAGAAGVWSSVCDVSKEEQVTATVDGTVKKFGQLDVVVNNAGLMVFKPIEEQRLEDWWRVLGVDLLGGFFFIREAFRVMNNGGAIVNVSSVHAVETTPHVASYAAAKAALLSLTRSASLEGKAKNIRVNAVLPGAIDTPMLWENPNIKAGLETIQKGDVGQPEEIAAAIAYLASGDSLFVTGASLLIDGGRLARL